MTPSSSEHPARRMRYLAAVSLAFVACGSALARIPERELRPVASGYYSVQPPAEEKGPTDSAGNAVLPKVVPGFSQPPQTNDWWSSLIWGYAAGQKQRPYSERMFPHPLSMQAEARGLSLGYPTEPKVDAHGYFFPHRAELLVGVQGLSAPDTRVVRYGDWTVTARWSDAQHALDLTMGHGLPFVYATNVHGKARVTPGAGKLEIWKNEGPLAAVTIDGHSYGLFAPPGATWAELDGALVSDLSGRDYFSVAVLPERSDEVLTLFQRHAYAFVNDSKVSYRYDQARAQMVSRFELGVEQKAAAEPAGPASAETGDHASPSSRVETPLLALYRHQWRHTSAVLSSFSYVSPRGEMKLLEGGSFETVLPVSGLLPALPDMGTLDKGRLKSLLKLVVGDSLFKPGLEGTRDSYWEGKSFGKVAGLVRIADQIDEPGMRDELLAGLKRELEDWFDGQPPRYYYRNETWRTLIGIPTMYQSGAMLNDHHFHYGYYVFAAATVAQYDRAWAARWAPFVEALIKDADNWQRNDTSFPYLRYFDPYAGHSWASGTSFFDTGNNEESSSEDMNFASAVALWGAVVGHTEVRDLGLFLYANVTEAIAQYWFDVDHAVFPKAFPQPGVGIVWGSGAAYNTWFSPLVESIHGIQLTPMLTGSLWLGKYPAAIDRVFSHLLTERGAPASEASPTALGREYQPVIWRDMFWMMLALSHPEQPAQWFDDEHYFAPDDGNSLAYTYHFIQNLKAMGHVDASLSADTPLYAAFRKGNEHTYVAYNPSQRPITVTFSDGQTLQVASGALGSAHH
jgi:endoglucanase Acf2